MYILTVKACQRFGAGNRKSTGEIDHRGLRYELVPVSECFNDWGGRGYDDSVFGEVTETTPSGDRAT